MLLSMSNLDASAPDDCHGVLPPQALLGLELFNRGKYFEAHEALEAAWRAESAPIRELYRGILQAAVVYLHIRRRNYPGAIKVYLRCRKYLDRWGESCRGVQVGRLRADLEAAIRQVERLGEKRLAEFDPASFKPVEYARD
jgi:uncharacterized protein